LLSVRVTATAREGSRRVDHDECLGTETRKFTQPDTNSSSWSLANGHATAFGYDVGHCTAFSSGQVAQLHKALACDDEAVGRPSSRWETIHKVGESLTPPKTRTRALARLIPGVRNAVPPCAGVDLLCDTGCSSLVWVGLDAHRRRTNSAKPLKWQQKRERMKE
jgi:hypothetical protein